MANSSSRYSVLTAAHWGPMLVETDGETVFSSRGALATGMENSLQSAVRDQVHSNTRVRFPMVRKGFLASPENPQGIRGQDEFVRVSWDEALDRSWMGRLISFSCVIRSFVLLSWSFLKSIVGQSRYSFITPASHCINRFTRRESSRRCG